MLSPPTLIMESEVAVKFTIIYKNASEEIPSTEAFLDSEFPVLETLAQFALHEDGRGFQGFVQSGRYLTGFHNTVIKCSVATGREV